MDYVTAKWLHILSSTLLLGTGLGTAYYLFSATLTRNPLIIAAVARNVVNADWAFTATSIIIQPLTGFYLVYLAGNSAGKPLGRMVYRFISAYGCLLASGSMAADPYATFGCGGQ